MLRRFSQVVLLLVAGLLVSGASGAADGTPPLITFDLTGAQGTNGWYVTPVTVRWQVSDPESGIKSSAGCDAATLTGDTSGTRLTCTATNLLDVISSASLSVKIDRTAPVVSGASADRAPDNAGWYTKPVTFAFAGTDALSGLAGCTRATYPGPDNGTASVPGTCTDGAGNVSAPVAASFKFDAHAPVLSGVSARSGDGEIVVRWQPLPAWEWVEVLRSTAELRATQRALYAGKGGTFTDRRVQNGVRYRYAVVGRDEAGHATQATVLATPVGPLRTPTRGARVRAPVALTWKPVQGARLYNVQLFRGSRKLLSAWPKGPRLKVPSAWRYAGRRRLLLPGLYRWYVWPAFREAKGIRYGKLIGASTFVIAKS